MNIYKMKSDELKKAALKFNATPFGARAYVWSTFPVFFGIASAIILVVISFLSMFNEDVANYETLLVLFMFFSFLVASLTQLQYGRMLKEFIEIEKKK